MQLRRAQHTVQNVFEIHGTDEDDLTAALAFALSRSPTLLAGLLRSVGFQRVRNLDDALIEIQKTEGHDGRTDIELSVPASLRVIVEAKVGQAFPGEQQLKKYKKRLDCCAEPQTALVVLTNVVPALARRKLGDLHPRLAPLQLHHISWREVRKLALRTKGKASSNVEKRMLADLAKTLEGVLQMERKFDNRVYVVSLGGGNPEGWSISWKDIVNERARYFYPVGKNWPDPPNYVAFRYDGKLQTIHHVERWDVFTDPHEMFPEAASDDWPPHYNFKLGPPMRPDHDVKNGPRVQRSARVWCMLDTLLTSKTITEAMEETKRREAARD